MVRANRSFGWAALVLAVVSLLAALVSGGVARSAQSEAGVRVEKAWVSSVPIAGHPAAGYITLVGGASADTLVGASSTDASSIELHDNRMAGGMMKMTTELSVEVPAHGRVVFGERGRHLMIFGLKPGKSMLSLKLRFASGRSVLINAPVRSIGSRGPSPSAATRAI